ncbi:hypothetical protein WB66_21665 [bacteria symbiont BFo1 of Frankliniella occidentalis]|nr:hypothetical protein AI28_16955 [bacteria symbiont BFo1 of Frankliniella occidentalis]KYP82648.1 hypothetical protein WB66_21665 [bacteria symbiont BFo1 of Frankliniella occidentalis]KYP90117.1 hypothetical protein WB91_10345 [bacteria symbiont BFo1 of Frankliniella occidentalis]
MALSDGILIGESAGAVLFAAREVAKHPENYGKRIVTVLADSGLNYLKGRLRSHPDVAARWYQDLLQHQS